MVDFKQHLKRGNKMAKKTTTDLAARQTMALDAPRGTGRGTENLKPEHIQLPRLALCQSLTKQRNTRDPLWIEGLEEGLMWNTGTLEVYGEGPIRFLPLRFKERGIEYNPLDAGGGVKDMNIPTGRRPDGSFVDTRLNFKTEGDNRNPTATLFHEWLVYLPASGEVIILSMKSSQLKVSRQFNLLVALPKRGATRGDTFDRAYDLTTVPERSAKGEYFNFKIRPASRPDPEEYVAAEEIYESLKGTDVTTDVEQESTRNDGDIPS